MRDLAEILARLRELPTASPAALVTIVEVEGSSYRREGARMLVEPAETAGGLTGLLSGGCLERDLVTIAAAAIDAGAPRTVRYDLTSDEEALWGFGTGCSGKVTLLVEPLDPRLRTETVEWLCTLLESRRPVERTTVYRVESGEARQLEELLLPPVHLLLVGAERDTPALVRLARELGWATTVIDPRGDEASRGRFADLGGVRSSTPRELESAVELSARTAVVLATHRYLDDLAYLEVLLPAPVAYLALLGPAVRRDRLVADLESRRPGAAAAARERLRGPAGLDLGGRAPEEVALSIVAEIQATFAGRDARPLSARASAQRPREAPVLEPRRRP